MHNYVEIAAVSVSATGALLLCKGIAFQGAKLYAREQPAALYPRSANIARDVARARDVADSQAGALLLVVGFIGQAVAAWQTCWSSEAIATAYGASVLVVIAAVGGRRFLQRRFEKELYLAHVDQEFRGWPDDASKRSAQQSYVDYLERVGRGEDIDQWADEAQHRFGVDPRAW